ncbi:DNA-directed RNA polymerase II subunit RPB1 [Platanthera zijinensis]|uniref:DNA-directed RNA polymerase subunit n=1 Tax=Platanthera zijinensis TaxID=2320716 RepID=A0AAP0ATZ2_9ASPA
MSDARLRPDEAASETVDSIQFSFYSSAEARRISIKEITKPELLDTKDSPIQGGLYDPALGPIKELDTCKSCGQQGLLCPGHYGHIELARLIFNPLLFRNLKNILQMTCFYCHKFRMGQEKVLKYVSILKLIVEGNVTAAKKLANNIWDVAIFGPGDTKQHFNSHSNVNYLEGKWTSIQQTEAASVLQEIMREKPRKCDNCKKSNPKVESLMFGWLEKSLKGSQIRDNYIQDSSFGLSTAGGKKPHIDNSDCVDNDEIQQTKSFGISSEGDGTMLGRAKSSKKTNRTFKLPPEIIKQMTSSGRVDLPPSEAEGILKALWRKESELCMLMCDIQCKRLRVSEKKEGYAMFFLKTLLVPPNKFRPYALGASGILEHPHNVFLINVLESNISLADTQTGQQNILQKWKRLQYRVNLYFDSSKAFGRMEKQLTGIRQLLDKKEGLLRQKMMGKRVNFACRSVISPDPYLAVNEIGIPPHFALRLTYPERVTPWNVSKLRQAVMNGADYPGATHYRDRDKFYSLKAGKDMRTAISRKLPTSRAATKIGMDPETKYEGKFVYRHLQDGDIVLVNRQPTLHKPSMMAHVVRVLNGENTIRMHYANCSTYNADFDGDEMNVHLPQDEISRAESIHIVNANKQYIVPTSGDPIRGLIQDHIVSAVLLTKMDTFLTREEYNQLLYASYVPSPAYGSQAVIFGQKISSLVSVDEIQSLPPAIWKPKPLWTGKQVITAILHHITKGQLPLTVKKEGRIPKEYFGKDATESQLFVYNNDLVHGVIDKAQFGKYGLVHTVHEFYGADTAGRLLAVFSRLFTLFLQMHGFTCGVDDLLVFQESDIERKRILEKSEKQSKGVHSRFTAATTDDFIDPLKLLKKTEKVIRRNGESATTRLDRMMSNALNALTSEVNKALFPGGLQKPFPNNCLSLMTATGAKGGLVNMTQISSLLGQQELEGKRVPRMSSGKTLPCFPAWDISSRAGGFISDRFLTGLRPQEYYFHCMAGREGLVDTAIKTSRSGYLQRCLVKNLESLKVCYDHTVRDADGTIIQFTYGEDGVDVQKSSFLGEFEIITMNQKVLLEKLSGQLESTHLSKSNSFAKELPDELEGKALHFLRSISKNPNSKGSLSQIQGKDLMKLVKLNYLSSLVEPGEAVGVLAAQSVGEPSTQMTLNTFHLAGHGELNVTLGIPRLTEILMNAKVDISTPVMTCPLLDQQTREDAELIASKLGRICLADIIERIEVSTVPFYSLKNMVFNIYKVTLKLYSPELYPPHSGITLEACMDILQTVFLRAMEDDITKHLASLYKIRDIYIRSANKYNEFLDESGSQIAEENADDGDVDKDVVCDAGGEDDANLDGDGDGYDDLGADAEKRKRQANDEMEYDDDIESENDGMQSGSEGEVDEMGAQDLSTRVKEGAMEKEASQSPSASDDGVDTENDSMRSRSEGEGDFVGVEDDHEAGGQDLSTLVKKKTSKGLSTSKSKPVRATKKRVKSDVNETAFFKSNGKKHKRIILIEPNGLEVEVHFKFNQDEPHVLLAEVAQRTAMRVYVKACNNIERCSVVEPKRPGDPLQLQTAGINFNALWDLHEYVDINKIVTNNIHAMLTTYGVEAARMTIINEVKCVFDAYGIRVNVRHLMLIADLMTCNGEYRALNRIGIRGSNTSPFSRMSFETATSVITESAFRGDVDTMDSPSACISLGKIVKSGTGGFDILQNLHL